MMTAKQEADLLADGSELLCSLMREDRIPVGKKTQIADLAIDLHTLAKRKKRELKQATPQ